jgi:TolB-like protein
MTDDRARRLVLTTAVLAVSAVSAPAQAGPPVVAILPFQDRGSFGQDQDVFRALELGIPATIEAELSGHSELRLVDPARVSQALQSQHFDAAARLDAATAARVAKEVGAGYAVTGNFADFYGRFRLDARVIEAATGQILKVVSNTDPDLQDRTDLYRILQRVGHQVLAVADPSAMGHIADAEGRLIPTGALVQFSLGLLRESQGDREKAAQHYTQALSSLPNYPEARAGLRRVRGP